VAISDELEKLSKLHESGELTDEEYAKAKDAALRAAGREPDSYDGPGFTEDLFGGNDESLGRAANRYVSFQIVSAVVGLIVFVLFLAVMCQGNNFPRFGP
jgi:hypothetical protein